MGQDKKEFKIGRRAKQTKRINDLYNILTASEDVTKKLNAELYKSNEELVRQLADAESRAIGLAKSAEKVETLKKDIGSQDEQIESLTNQLNEARDRIKELEKAALAKED